MPTIPGSVRGRPPSGQPEAATTLRPVVEALFGTLPVPVELWDGSRLGPQSSEAGVLWVRSVDAVRRLAWSPDELGVARAYVAGEIDFEGDIFALVRSLRPAGRAIRSAITAMPVVVSAAKALGALGSPLPPPPEELKPRGRRHSRERDAHSVRHHYDVGNDFYAIVLGPSLTYSCGRFTQPGMTLAAAQTSKHELICRKLGLHERREQRLLDVGCGWGSMAMHAAARHEATVVGVTISPAQAELARQRVAEAGLQDRVEIRVQDYRDVRGERFDAISSIGMFEHVGKRRMGEYFATLHALLHPTGRLLNHAISSVHGSRLGRRDFVYRYVFPDGELMDVGDTIKAMQDSGFEVRDVESLREHYTTTLRHWVANLEESWDEAVRLIGAGRARVWRLYMAASAVGFEDGGVSLHQVLGVRDSEGGQSAMPATRDTWTTGPA